MSIHLKDPALEKETMTGIEMPPGFSNWAQSSSWKYTIATRIVIDIGVICMCATTHTHTCTDK